MEKELTMPKLRPEMENGVLCAWLKEEGEGGIQLFSSAENPAVIRLMERLLATKP